jgi:hypothetical protein
MYRPRFQQQFQAAPDSAMLLVNGVNPGRQPFPRRGQLMSSAPGLRATI